MADKVFRWHNDLFARETLEDFGNDMVDWGFIMGIQLVFVLGLQKFLSHVEIQVDLIIKLELHNDEWIPRLTLSKGRIKSKGDESVDFVVLR